LIAQREDLMQIAKPGVEEEAVERAGPFRLQNVGGFDLTPGCIRADKSVRPIAPEKPVLLVKPPDEIEVIVCRDLIVAAECDIALMV
jgi:hypothetical protein